MIPPQDASSPAQSGCIAQPGRAAGAFTENGLRVLRARYLKKDEAGRVIEEPKDLFERVAGTIAEVETIYGATPEAADEWKKRFFDLMWSGKFMPNSPTLMNAGREMGMLSACFVLPVKDSIDEIFDSIKHTALIQKAGGGTGFAFDELRPTGDFIRSSGGTTSGPISFWRAFSEATNAIQQGAFRRGANMGMMYIHHPDILKFLHAKQDLTRFTNYNISVKVTDEWMDALLADPDAPHVVRNPRTGTEYFLPKDLDIWSYSVRDLLEKAGPDDGPGSRCDVYTRRQIWDIILANAHATGEPGVVYIDRINEHNPTPQLGRIEATNPCGEQPLLPYEACNLGSINLKAFVLEPCSPQVRVDWEGLREAVHLATRFLDNVIDANRYPLPEIDRICKANRKIGLGIMGFADALYGLGVGYNTEEGLAWAERFMGFVNDEAHQAGEALARDRGSFPNWEGSTWDTVHRRPMRNATVTTIAPTGTISIIAGCSGGIEPLFSLAFYRNVLKGQDRSRRPMIQVSETFRRVAEQRGFLSEGLMERVATEGTLAHLAEIPQDIRRVFVCAHDIAPQWHVRMQAAFQKHCDASISKTINFPSHATQQDVDAIYRMAYELGCKGVTVYRDGCRRSQPMALARPQASGSAASEEVADEPPEPAGSRDSRSDTLVPRDLPEIVSGLRVRQMTPFGNMHVNITVDTRTGRELEVFAQLGKGGDLANSDLEALCRMISLWLRARGSLKQVIHQLKDIGSSLQVSTRDGKIMSLGDGLARALLKYQRAKTHFGLRDLLLGEVDFSELDRPLGSGNGKHATRSAGRPGNGKGNGHGRDNGNGGRAVAPEPRQSQTDLTPTNVPLSYERRMQGYKLKCHECHSPLEFTEGCVKCTNPECGYAAC
jgi:ribonucleoside-diphosphate reductase alpha chain